jgi:hypothetical protein
MRIAILLPGQPRFTGDFNNFISNIKGYQQADWFFYITNNNVSTKSEVQLSTFWSTFDPLEAFEKIKNKLPENNFIQSFEISNDTQISYPSVRNTSQSGPVENVFKMFYNLYQSDQLRQQYEQTHNFKYDLVIRTRPDVGVDRLINLPNLDIQENQIVMPNNRWYGSPSCNDQFAIGNSNSMKIYSELYNKIKEYNDNGTGFHPESLLGHHLSKNNINYITKGFDLNLRHLPLDD